MFWACLCHSQLKGSILACSPNPIFPAKVFSCHDYKGLAAHRVPSSAGTLRACVVSVTAMGCSTGGDSRLDSGGSGDS